MGVGSGAAADLVLRAACERCGAASDLYGTPCRHTTLCTACGRALARARGRCAVCAAPVTRLIRVLYPRPVNADFRSREQCCLSGYRSFSPTGIFFSVIPQWRAAQEYDVRLDTYAERAHFIGRFATGLPPLSKTRSAGNKWSLRKDVPQGRQLTGNMRVLFVFIVDDQIMITIVLFWYYLAMLLFSQSIPFILEL